MNKKIIIKLILVILWMSVIFIFSSQNGIDSSKLSQGITYKVVELFKGKNYPEDKKEECVEKLGLFIRKGAHFFVYFVLAILVYILLIEFKISTTKLILYTIIICMLYAITDELHQGFISGRAARVFDVFIDTCGATLSTSIMYIGNKLKIKNK